jgi:hypothetical protein
MDVPTLLEESAQLLSRRRVALVITADATPIQRVYEAKNTWTQKPSPSAITPM